MCQKAIELGIVEIGFSEHMDFEPKDWGYGFFNYDKYTSEIQRAQEFFKDKLTIRKGVEIDYQHCFEDEIAEWLKDKEFDYIVGSVHYLDHEIISHRFVESNDLRKIYDVYFKEVTNSLESRLFGVIGHFDLVSRFLGNKKSELKSFDYWRSVKTILGEIVEKKMYLEINSKGLREGHGDTMPGKEIVLEFVETEGKLVSLGSDAHSTEEIGSGIKETMDSLSNFKTSDLKLLFE